MPEKKTPEHHLTVAEKHLKKVQGAWSEPTDWSDLTVYGFACLEALIHAAWVAIGRSTATDHKKKVQMSETLHHDYALTDISELMVKLNNGRKANIYGDEDFDESEYEAEEVARRIEEFFNEVQAFVQEKKTKET